MFTYVDLRVRTSNHAFNFHIMKHLQELSIAYSNKKPPASDDFSIAGLKKSSRPSVKKVIIIEDDEVLRFLFQRLLEREFQVSVTFKQNGLEGLEYARESKPDLIILDLMLPGMNGFDILRKIRSEKSLGQTKIMIVSAKASSDDIEKGFGLMADEYLTKPFQPKEFIARVRKLFLQYH